MNINKPFSALAGIVLCLGSTPASSDTVLYGVFAGNDKGTIVSGITGEQVNELAKVEDDDLHDMTASHTSDGLTITGTKLKSYSSYGKDKEYIAGTWEYTGTGSIDWLAIKFGRQFVLYQVTEGDTSGEWDLGDLGVYANTVMHASKSGRGHGKHDYKTYGYDKYGYKGKAYKKPAAFSHASAYNTIPQVPVPAALWLFVSGLIGLVAVSRRD